MAYDTYTPSGGSAISFYAIGPDVADVRDSATSDRHAPWGNENVVQLGGRLSNTLDLHVFVDLGISTFQTMKAQCGTQGVLVYQDFNGAAVLKKVSLNKRHPSGALEVTMSFICDAD